MKNGKIWPKLNQTVQQHFSSRNQSIFHVTLNLNKSLEKTKSKILLITYSTLDELSNDTTSNPLRSVYIDRPKLTEQISLLSE